MIPNTRKSPFPYQGVSAVEALGLIRSAATSLLTPSGGTGNRERFEESFTGFMGDGETVAFPSGRSALAALLIANGVTPGDEVLVTGLTCEAVIEAVFAIGAEPRWVDIDTTTMSMKPELAEQAISPKTRAIIVQHTFGIPLPIEKFRDLAKSNNLAIIEDCCLALGSRRQDGSLIGYGEFDAFWSFEMTKSISCGWGGMALVKDPIRADAIKSIRDKAGNRSRINSAKALNQAGISALCYRPQLSGVLAYVPVAMERIGLFRSSTAQIGGMTAKTAFESYGAAGPDAIWRYLEKQLKRLPTQLERVRHNNNLSLAALQSVGVEVPSDWLADTTILLRIPILVKNRDAFEAHMWRNRVDTARWFESPVSATNTQHEYGYSCGTCPVGESVAASISNLPTHSNMSESDVKSATSALAQYFQSNTDEAEFMSTMLSSETEAQ
jgi:perosamine synthetase